MEFISKLEVVVEDGLPEISSFVLGGGGELVNFCDEGDVVEGIHVVVHACAESVLVVLEGEVYEIGIDDEVEGSNEGDDKEGGQAVTPDVDALVVHHEQTFHYFARGVEVDAVPMRDVAIFLHVDRGSLIGPDEVVFLHSHRACLLDLELAIILLLLLLVIPLTHQIYIA